MGNKKKSIAGVAHNHYGCMVRITDRPFRYPDRIAVVPQGPILNLNWEVLWMVSVTELAIFLQQGCIRALLARFMPRLVAIRVVYFLFATLSFFALFLIAPQIHESQAVGSFGYYVSNKADHFKTTIRFLLDRLCQPLRILNHSYRISDGNPVVLLFQ